MAPNQVYTVTKQGPGVFEISESPNYEAAVQTFKEICQNSGEDILVSLGIHTWDTDQNGNVIWFNTDGGIWQEGQTKAWRKVRSFEPLAESVSWFFIYSVLEQEEALEQEEREKCPAHDCEMTEFGK